MSTNNLKCDKCKSWFIPFKEKMLCPKCDSIEINRVGKEYARKFIENKMLGGVE